MVFASKVLAEVRYLGVEPNCQFIIEQALDNDKIRLVLDGEDRDWTGKEVVVKCAQKAGKQQLVNKILGARRFTYSAPPVMVQQAEADLAARGAAHRAQPRPPAGARGFRSAGAAAQPTAPATPAQHAAAAAVAHRGACRAPGTSDAGLLDATPDTLQQQLLQGAGSLADIELRARICSQSGDGLVSEMDAQLQAWHASKRALQAGQQQQEASLATHRNEIRLKMAAALGNSADVDEFMAGWLQKYEEKAGQHLEALTQQEAAAHQRCMLVQQAILRDPAALLLYTKGCKRPGVLGYAVVTALVAVGMAVLQCLFPQCWQAVKAALVGLARKCVMCLCGLVGVVLVWARALLLLLKTITCGLLRGGMYLLSVAWRLACWTCSCIGKAAACCVQRVWRSAAGVRGCSPAQAPGLQPHWQPLHRMCLPAAATAASMYTATASMHSVLTGMRAYYNPHQHSNPATYSLAGYHTSQQQQQVAAPSAADLLAVVVGVSRLVQVAHGALHGNGECNLRNHVLRLLEGLLGVGGRGLITAEVAMSGGRSDLVISDLQGRSLLVVEYKQRHSGQASACQQQDMGQLTRYLKDRRHGCEEGLLIIFDKALPNGLSATRLTRAPASSGAQLHGSPVAGLAGLLGGGARLMMEPLHHLESDPLAVGVMMGLCQGYGVEVLQD